MGDRLPGGMDQGNVDTTDKWVAFFDPLLCALDMCDSQFFYQACGGRIEAATGRDSSSDAAVVNDLVFFTGTHAALQAKADLVSAIYLIFWPRGGGARALLLPSQQTGTDTHTHPPCWLYASRGSASTRRSHEALRGPLGHERGQQHARGAVDHTAVYGLGKDD